ncbi:vitellogenic carboxypeptidase-like [Venturia canescens]|uniref:vitellogenic carboxypeptidase-like n=1 Tax=Venturia canescens TaxID=32260 RepID=UPI001C9C664A|nr:vitellogenic carboxypeptidase-like [Venturia canescens]
MNTLISRKQHKEAFESAERFFKEAPMQNVINKFNVQNSYTFKFPWNSVPSDFKNLNEAISEFFNRSDVAKALHVGSKAFTQNSMELKNRLVHNITESHLSTVEKLLSQYRFLILTGKKDLSCPHEFVVSYLSTLSGDVGDAYRDTKRLDWRDEKDEVIGSIVKAGRLTEMLLDNSGHLISVDNEKNVVSVLEAFTEDSFGVNEEKPVSVVSCMKKEGRFCALYRSFVAPSKIFPFNSYAGYINVNEKFNSNLFFWYVVAKEKPHTAPVILCLHGVLGRSSLFKLFNANGPVTIRDGFVEESLSSWHKTNHVIYIDSPIGAGYSYTDSDEGYSTSDAQVAANLREALIQLFKLHPQLRKNGLFLVGDNYAGKFIPALGHSIHLYNEKAISSRKINFRGMLISNGYVNPLKQLNYTTPLSDDIITDECKSEFLTMEREVHDLINKDKHYEASEATLRFREKGVCDWGKDPMLDFPFTALGPKDESEYDRLIKFLNRTDIRRILHVGNRAFANFSQPVFDHLKNDITRSQAETLKVLLNHYRVLILSGRADSICPYTNVRGYLREIIPDFPNFADIKMTEKFTSKTECKLKKFGNLTLLELDRLGNWIFENNQDLSPEILNGFVAGSL